MSPLPSPGMQDRRQEGLGDGEVNTRDGVVSERSGLRQGQLQRPGVDLGKHTCLAFLRGCTPAGVEEHPGLRADQVAFELAVSVQC